ncbi:MAG: hypothetical protein Q9P01_14845 [Anaerolineae bacterium]|nr:hypothetical protein [Anaerolineae bacterium]
MPPALITDGPVASQSSTAYEAIQRLRAIYCSTIGYDNEHIHNPKERIWLREAIEARRYRYGWGNDENLKMLERLTQVEALEHFLQRAFPTKYRFSIEGLDVMIPMLDEVVRYAGETTNTKNLYIGMAHRGRLNVLAHIMQRDYQRILAEFKDTRETPE